MTDHGKCTTCGRDMHPASRYGGLCWECHDAEGQRKDAEIRVLRDAVKVLLGDPEYAVAKAECLCGWMHLDNEGKAIINRIFDE